MAGIFSKITAKSTRYLGCALAALFIGQSLGQAQLSGNGNLFVQLSDPQLSLGAPILTSGQVQLPLNGEPGVSYVVESSSNAMDWTPIVTNNDAAALRTVSIPVSNSSGFYRAVRALLPLAAYALAARGNMSLVGNSQTTDSFNSSDPAFSTNGQYDPAKAETNGNVACASGIIDIGNHWLGGSLFLGQSAQYVSSTNKVMGEIYSNQSLGFPDVVLPASAREALAAPSNAGSYVLSMDNTSYYVSSSSGVKPIAVAAGLTNVTLFVFWQNVTLDVRLLGAPTNSGNVYIYLLNPATNGTVTLAGSTVNNPTYKAKNLCIFGSTNLSQVTIPSGTTNFTGVIYAPSASLSLSSDLLNVSGSCIFGSVTVNGRTSFHFDEDLLTNGPCH